MIELELQVKPTIHAKEILETLMKKYPDDFCKGHIRTLQRHVSELRAQQENREKKYQDLMVSKKLMTTTSLADNIDNHVCSILSQ